MDATILGYLAYVFICLFSPMQLVFMVRRKSFNLGAWPQFSLVLGLLLLQLSFAFVVAPMYVIVGNAVSLGFSAINLLNVTNPVSALRRWAWAKPVEVKGSVFALKQDGAYEVGGNTYAGDTAAPAQGDFCQEPDDRLRARDFTKCENDDCRSLILKDDAHPVEVGMRNIQYYISHKGWNNLPWESQFRWCRVAFYCDPCRPQYDRIMVDPGLTAEQVSTVLFFKEVTEQRYSDDNAGVPYLERVGWAQVYEDGTPFD